MNRVNRHCARAQVSEQKQARRVGGRPGVTPRRRKRAHRASALGCQRAVKGPGDQRSWAPRDPSAERAMDARSAAVGVRPPRSAPGISPPSVRFPQCPVPTPRLLGTPPSPCLRLSQPGLPRGRSLPGRGGRRARAEAEAAVPRLWHSGRTLRALACARPGVRPASAPRHL